MGGADADDGACDGMSGADGDPGSGSREESDGARSLGAESADWFELGDAGSHGVNDTPSAKVGAEGDGGVGGQNDWPVIASPGTSKFGCGDDVGAEERTGDDAHRLLGIVAAVSETVSGSGEKLQAAKPGVNAPRWLVAQDPENSRHESEGENQAHDGC